MSPQWRRGLGSLYGIPVSHPRARQASIPLRLRQRGISAVALGPRVQSGWQWDTNLIPSHLLSLAFALVCPFSFKIVGWEYVFNVWNMSVLINTYCIVMIILPKTQLKRRRYNMLFVMLIQCAISCFVSGCKCPKSFVPPNNPHLSMTQTVATYKSISW